MRQAIESKTRSPHDSAILKAPTSRHRTQTAPDDR